MLMALRPAAILPSAGVQFMFRCLAGLKDPGFTGCIQSDSMGEQLYTFCYRASLL